MAVETSKYVESLLSGHLHTKESLEWAAGGLPAVEKALAEKGHKLEWDTITGHCQAVKVEPPKADEKEVQNS